MANACVIEVRCKKGVTDPVGQGLTRDINHLGLGKVKGVASAQLYQIQGSVAAHAKVGIARDLLADPILHDYHIDDAPSPPTLSPRERAAKGLGEGHRSSLVIDVWYKTGVTDVVGDSVLKGIRDLNIDGVKEVRTGMRYHLHGITKREIAERVALALLVNPLVHDSIIHAD
jgi:phosphoribosylformylglycinamidine (FGAM) synthase PurS component